MTVQFPAAHWLWSILYKSLFIFQRYDICSMKWVVPLFIDWIRTAHSLYDVIGNHFTCVLITFYWSWIYYFQLSLIQKYCQHLLCFWLNLLPSYMTNYFPLLTKWPDLHFGTQCPCQYKIMQASFHTLPVTLFSLSLWDIAGLFLKNNYNITNI
jgi:hypothetical protein